MVGRNGLTREVLISTLEAAGASGVSSFLATGNLVFGAEEDTLADIVIRVSGLLLQRQNVREPIFVRSLQYLEEMTVSDPFAAAPTDAIYEQCVTFLTNDFHDLGSLPIVSSRRDVEIFAHVNSEAFSVTHMIDGRTGNAGALIERLTGYKVTTRNWNTIIRLLDKYN